MTEDAWAALADPFVEGAYASVKGQVRTYVLHQQLLRHLPPAPASVLDVGGGAGHQSLPLARLGYDVTILDPSEAMLAKAEERIGAESDDVRARVRLLQADGERAAEATGRRFAAVLCHGVLLYQPDPAPLVEALCACVEPGGVVSVMTLNSRTMAVRAAVERRWADALAGFEAGSEIGPLGVPTWARSVDDVAASLASHGIELGAWYGVLLFTDWTELPLEVTDVRAVAEVELEASLRDPYRQLSRAFHVVGTRGLPPGSQRSPSGGGEGVAMTTDTAQSTQPTQTRFPGQAAAPDGPIDLVNMYLFHHAFRRDLDRFAAAVPRTPVDDLPAWQRLVERWGVFARQLHHHHESEDRVLWPWLRERADARELVMLDDMEAEHDAIDPGLAAVTTSFALLAQPGGDRDDVRNALSVRLHGVREVLDRHLAHEEVDAMAMLQRVGTQREWAALEKQFGKGEPLRHVVELVPWALYGVDEAILRRLMSTAPPPMRLMWRLTRTKFERREAAAFSYA